MPFKGVFRQLKDFLKDKIEKLFSIMRKVDFNIILTRNFILIVIAFFSLFYILKVNINSTLNLTAIYAIIGAILSSLFIFIMAEGLRDKEQPYKIKIFFKESGLITIIILFLISLPFLLFQKNNVALLISLSALFSFIALSIYSISKIALITLNSEELWKKHINLFKSRIKEAIKFSQTIKSNSDKFYNFIKAPQNNIQWLIPKEPDNTSLKSLTEGTITNINLQDLKDIIKKIKNYKVKQNI